MSSALFFPNLPVNQEVNGEPTWTCNIEYHKHYHIDERQFSLWEHCIMDIEERHSHRDNHREDCYSDHQTGYQEKRAAKFTEDAYHQTHVASKSQYIWKSLRQFIEIGNLVNAMSKEQYTKEYSEA